MMIIDRKRLKKIRYIAHAFSTCQRKKSLIQGLREEELKSKRVHREVNMECSKLATEIVVEEQSEDIVDYCQLQVHYNDRSQNLYTVSTVTAGTDRYSSSDVGVKAKSNHSARRMCSGATESKRGRYSKS